MEALGYIHISSLRTTKKNTKRAIVSDSDTGTAEREHHIHIETISCCFEEKTHLQASLLGLGLASASKGSAENKTHIFIVMITCSLRKKNQNNTLVYLNYFFLLFLWIRQQLIIDVKKKDPLEFTGGHVVWRSLEPYIEL
ncbi:hypothetical protein ACJX0J_014096 [Zea mays]